MKQSKFNAFEREIFLFFDVADGNGRVNVLIMNTVITYIYSFFLKIKTTNFRRIYIIYILDKDIKFGFKKNPLYLSLSALLPQQLYCYILRLLFKYEVRR